MKHTGACPKCGSTEILFIGKPDGAYMDYDYIATGAFSRVDVRRYVCCTCGYVEERGDQADIAKLKKVFPKL